MAFGDRAHKEEGEKYLWEKALEKLEEEIQKIKNTEEKLEAILEQIKKDPENEDAIIMALGYEQEIKNEKANLLSSIRIELEWSSGLWGGYLDPTLSGEAEKNMIAGREKLDERVRQVRKELSESFEKGSGEEFIMPEDCLEDFEDQIGENDVSRLLYSEENKKMDYQAREKSLEELLQNKIHYFEEKLGESSEKPHEVLKRIWEDIPKRKKALNKTIEEFEENLPELEVEDQRLDEKIESLEEKILGLPYGEGEDKIRRNGSSALLKKYEKEKNRIRSEKKIGENTKKERELMAKMERVCSEIEALKQKNKKDKTYKFKRWQLLSQIFLRVYINEKKGKIMSLDRFLMDLAVSGLESSFKTFLSIREQKVEN